MTSSSPTGEGSTSSAPKTPRNVFAGAGESVAGAPPSPSATRKAGFSSDSNVDSSANGAPPKSPRGKIRQTVVNFKTQKTARFCASGSLNNNNTNISQLAKSTRQKRQKEEKQSSQGSASAGQSWIEKLDRHRNRLSPQSLVPLQARDEEDGKAQEEDESEVDPDINLTHFQAHELAQRLNLPAGDVTKSWRQFKRYDFGNRGRLNPSEFQLLLRSLLRERYPRVRDMPRELFTYSHARGKDISFSEFLTWLAEHEFSEAVLLTAEQQSLRANARQMKVPIPLAEHISFLFNSYDLDGDGMLAYEEFQSLLRKLMGCQAAHDLLPESRVQAFWKDVDANRTGMVGFDIFLSWYLRYFDNNSGETCGSAPLENYYANMRNFPRVDRGNWW